jgi:hypothetical protein
VVAVKPFECSTEKEISAVAVFGFNFDISFLGWLNYCKSLIIPFEGVLRGELMILKLGVMYKRQRV